MPIIKLVRNTELFLFFLSNWTGFALVFFTGDLEIAGDDIQYIEDIDRS